MSTLDEQTLGKLLNKAKIGLMQKADSFFFATILFSMKFVWDDTMPTAWTTGLRLGFNRDFFRRCTPGERIFVLVHECCHVAYMHIARTGNRDRKLFNIAADHVINLMLEERGFEMPSWVCKDPRFKGMGTEQVYDLLLQEQQAGMPPPQDTGMDDIRAEGEDGNPGGEPVTGPNGKPMTPAEVKRTIDDIIIRAVTQSKLGGDRAGTVPGEIELYLDKLLNPKLPWQTILRKHLSEKMKSGYSWKKPNRRFFPQHYLPSHWGEGKLASLQAWVDISGSETDEDFLRFISEVHGVVSKHKPETLDLGQFDTEIKSITKIKSIMDMAKLKFHGRGGTIITDVLDHIEKTRPKLALIFTDGGFRMDRERCNSDVIWMIHDNENWTAPFGKVIHYTTH